MVSGLDVVSDARAPSRWSQATRPMLTEVLFACCEKYGKITTKEAVIDKRQRMWSKR